MKNNTQAYIRAKKRVKKIKGFYIHLLVYIIVNSYIVIANLIHSDIQSALYASIGTLGFWGLGIIAHWISVFGKNLFFSKKWEQRKIDELMNS